MHCEATPKGINKKGLDPRNPGSIDQMLAAKRLDKRYANADVVTTMTRWAFLYTIARRRDAVGENAIRAHPSNKAGDVIDEYCESCNFQFCLVQCSATSVVRNASLRYNLNLDSLFYNN